jgi:hypothetical protein
MQIGDQLHALPVHRRLSTASRGLGAGALN